MNNFDFDAAIVGGGPAGSTAALTLARAGYNVVLIEGSRYEQPRVGETLPPSAHPLLKRLGLWDAFMTLGSAPSFGNQSAWGGSELWSNPFIFSPYGEGWHLDRQRFDSFLATAAVSAGTHCCYNRQVIACDLTAEKSWRLTLKSPEGDTEELNAQVVIDATGRRAAVASRIGGTRQVYDHLVGVAVQYRKPQGAAGYTLVEAAPHGWWYSAPVPPDRMMVMFMTDADLCRSYHYSDLEVWQQKLAQTLHTCKRIDSDERLWEPKIFSAISHRLKKKDWDKRWLACGDATMGVDPLSSSGLMRALRTGEFAGQAMIDWLQGKPERAFAYEHLLDTEFADYLSARHAYYAQETRWSEMPFWKRRLKNPVESGFG